MTFKLPEPLQEANTEPVRIEGLKVGVISDLHVPYHDKKAIEIAVRYLKRCSIDQLILLGDIVDFYSISRFDKARPLNNDLSLEIADGRKLLQFIRHTFPSIPIKWKEGNHDDRLKRFIASKVPELSNLGALTTSNLFRLSELDIEFFTPSNHFYVETGEETLWLIHGHEIMGSGGKNPAYRLYQKAMTSSLCGHFHRTSEYWQRDLSGKIHRCYTIGALCGMTPEYMRLHNWNHGFAVIELTPTTYHVDNKRIIEGGVR